METILWSKEIPSSYFFIIIEKNYRIFYLIYMSHASITRISLSILKIYILHIKYKGMT